MDTPLIDDENPTSTSPSLQQSRGYEEIQHGEVYRQINTQAQSISIIHIHQHHFMTKFQSNDINHTYVTHHVFTHVASCME